MAVQDSTDHDQPHPAEQPHAADTVLNTQPLTGLGGGTSIRNISQPTPFSMVAITGNDLSATSVRIRAQRPDGSWGNWYEAEQLESNSDDSHTGGPRGTDPVFIGTTTTVQIAVTHSPQEPDPTYSQQLGYIPASVEKPLAQNISAVLISPPQAPTDTQWTPPTAILPPGQPPQIISRDQWGAGSALRCGGSRYGNGIRAAVVHHTAGSNNYSPEDSAAIVRAIYAYHTRTLGWCDIAYNALVDKYGQVFEGRAGGITRDVTGSHTGGFNKDVWGVSMIGEFDDTPPTDIQIRTLGRLLGWRMSLDHIDPLGTTSLTSAGGRYTFFPAGSTPTLPTIFTHRDVGNTDCPGDAGYAALPQIRNIAAQFNQPPNLVDALRGGAIFTTWQNQGGQDGPLGAPTSPEAAAAGQARYATFNNGAIYWSPASGAQPLTGAIYQAWAWLGYERGALGLPTSSEIHEPEWIVQNFQHGTLNFNRHNRHITRVIDGIALDMPATATEPPVQLERFSPIHHRVNN